MKDRKLLKHISCFRRKDIEQNQELKTSSKITKRIAEQTGQSKYEHTA